MERYKNKKGIRYKGYRMMQAVIWATSAVWIMAVSSCAYRMTDEDWEKNGKVRLLLRRSNSSCPDNMTWYFYPEDSESPLMRTGDVSGYEGTLPLGRYRVAVCNTGCTGVTLEMEKGYEEACGRAKQLSSLKSSSVQIACPGSLYGTGLEQIEVVGGETVAKELTPANLVRTLEMNIKVTGGDKGDVAAAVLSGRLTGVSSRVHIPSGKPLFDTPAFMTFEPEEVSPGVYTSSLNLFGLSPGEEGEDSVDLSLTMILSDGKEITSSTDITKEVKDAFTATVTTHVILDLVVRYDEISGLTITLTDWKPGSDGSGVVTP
ncbi:DUF5119 domain-containing protein [Parabacteroides faecis]|uniref:DUF5119 domain-containing protein n=1 Tax=Parabacteroides faecis TaxID=1217282 RepID=UPI002164D0D3|nr:DUF5119 domain-containing protein [Parabacteroides faecis]MCS2892585.1 DUF5119 domain-containing protein [Parabacteroides faecis]UVQ48777.1 DUF5119 domain-containing protein [Parabacteroides faecis]